MLLLFALAFVFVVCICLGCSWCMYLLYVLVASTVNNLFQKRQNMQIGAVRVLESMKDTSSMLLIFLEKVNLSLIKTCLLQGHYELRCSKTGKKHTPKKKHRYHVCQRVKVIFLKLTTISFCCTFQLHVLVVGVCFMFLLLYAILVCCCVFWGNVLVACSNSRVVCCYCMFLLFVINECS